METGPNRRSVALTMPAALSIAVVTLAMLSSVVARAQPNPEGIWGPVGLTAGGSFGTDVPGGAIYGIELSVARLTIPEETPMWLGGVADIVWDSGARAIRHRIGPEVGRVVFLPRTGHCLTGMRIP